MPRHPRWEILFFAYDITNKTQRINCVLVLEGAIEVLVYLRRVQYTAKRFQESLSLLVAI